MFCIHKQDNIYTIILLGFRCVGVNMTDIYVCCICDTEFDEEEVEHIEIKGNAKDICKECVTSVKGLI